MTLHDEVKADAKKEYRAPGADVLAEINKKMRQVLGRPVKTVVGGKTKIPVTLLSRKRTPGFLVCIHSDDLLEFCQEYVRQAEYAEAVDAVRAK